MNMAHVSFILSYNNELITLIAHFVINLSLTHSSVYYTYLFLHSEESGKHVDSSPQLMCQLWDVSMTSIEEIFISSNFSSYVCDS